MQYVGLTDNPETRRAQHGYPRDWDVVWQFNNEPEARVWERQMLAMPGYQGGVGGSGWRFGYRYTVTPNTIE